MRANAAVALGIATTWAEIVTALFGTLRDPNADVRCSASASLAQQARQPRAKTLVEFPLQLSVSLNLAGLDESGWIKIGDTVRVISPKDELFTALWSVAPGPQVPTNSS